MNRWGAGGVEERSLERSAQVAPINQLTTFDFELTLALGNLVTPFGWFL